MCCKQKAASTATGHRGVAACVQTTVRGTIFLRSAVTNVHRNDHRGWSIYPLHR